jgi:hypothetical protein
MYAQVIELPLNPKRLRELEYLVRFELLPALRDETGFSGATSLVDQERGKALLVLYWETEDEAAAPLATGDAPVQRAFTAIIELLGVRRYSPTIWEVSARA